MRSIRRENAKKILLYLVISICLIMVMANIAQASKGAIDNQTLEIDHRRIEYHNKTYDLYINHSNRNSIGGWGK
ncbi:MAG: hypothetical protein ACMUIP_16280 [bacterium]